MQPLMHTKASRLLKEGRPAATTRSTSNCLAMTYSSSASKTAGAKAKKVDPLCFRPKPHQDQRQRGTTACYS